jgi:peptidyl-dipeptidase Dcp
MHRENNAAQLRYFVLKPEYRKMGLGKKLMNLFMDFLKSHGYTSAYLWTTNEQKEAAALYKKFGFVKTADMVSTTFGKEVTEQRYDLVL